MRRLIGIILMLTVTTVTTQAQGEHKKLVADWQGSLEVQSGVKYKIRFHIKAKDGKLMATMDNVDLNTFKVKFDEATYVDGVLTLKINQLQGTYTGKLEGKELKGTWKQGPDEFALNMKKMATS